MMKYKIEICVVFFLLIFTRYNSIKLFDSSTGIKFNGKKLLTNICLPLLIIPNFQFISNSYAVTPNEYVKRSDDTVISSLISLTLEQNTDIISIDPANDINESSESNNKNILSNSQVQSEDSETEKLKLLEVKYGDNIFEILQRKFSLEKLDNMPIVTVDSTDLRDSQERVLTLKAYLDEAERNLFLEKWDKLIAYLNVFVEQDTAFANLIQGLYPSDSALDRNEREEMTLEAQTMFLAIDDLREAAKDHKSKIARTNYAKLLLAYDRFLKAGNLYPSYDVITSTEIFYKGTPSNTLRFDMSTKPQVLDNVILTSGPDMGKTGKIIDIEDNNLAVVKFDKDENFYSRVKEVELSTLAKPLT